MSKEAITRNALFYGDNLPILRRYVKDESVDLIHKGGCGHLRSNTGAEVSTYCHWVGGDRTGGKKYGIRT